MSNINQVSEERQEVIELYEDIGDAIEDEETEEAKELLSDLVDTHSQIRRLEKAELAQARATRDTADVTFEDQQQLSEFMRSASQTSVQRSVFYLTSVGMIAFPNEIDEDINSVVENSVAANQALTEAEGNIINTIQSANLPAQVTIVEASGPDPDTEFKVDDTFEVGTTIRNVGNQRSGEINVTLEAPDGLSFDDDEESIDALGAGEEESVNFDGTVMATGQFDIAVKATTESAGSSRETVPIIVLDEGPIDQVQDAVPDWAPTVAGGGGTALGIAGLLKYMSSDNDDPSGKSDSQ